MQNLMVVFTFPFFRPEICFLGKFRPKNQNCLLKVKFGTQTNLNFQNSMVLFTFHYRPEIPFFGQIWSEKCNCQYKLKFATYINSNMQNSIVKFTFTVFNWICPFWTNMVQKIKIVYLSWTLVPRIIQIGRI